MMREGILDDRENDLPGAAYSATATIDERGLVTGWSEGARLLLGYRSEDVVGRSATSLLAEDVSEATRGLRTGQQCWSGRVALRCRDGRRLVVGLLVHRRVTEGASPEWFLESTVTQVPSLPRGDALVDWAVGQLPYSLAIFDEELRLMRANTVMERVLALAEDDMRGLHLSEILPGSEGDGLENAMRLALRSGELQNMLSRLPVPGGGPEQAWFVSLTPLKDQVGRARSVCLVAHDVTEQYWSRQRLLLLNDASTRIGSTLDIERTAQELVDVVVPKIADFAYVDLLAFIGRGDEPPTGPLTGPVAMRRTAQGSIYEAMPETLVELGAIATYPAFSPPAECLAAGRAAKYEMNDSVIARWSAYDPSRADRIRAIGTHSVIVAPMRARGVTLGVALFNRHRRPEPFEEDDVLLAEEIAARAAVSIDNARRYTRERTTAVTLQRSLLPQTLPRQAALEVASRYLPAGARAGVGGDWFDVIPLSGARVALVVGDVVGHGIQASATMGRLRTAVRTLADIDLAPDELLTHLDDLVTRLSSEADAETAGDIGATCLYAAYDPVSHRCCLARAGHPLPVMVTPDGTAELLDLPAGPPLGLGGLPFESVEVDLPEGSLLALYTDGLIENRGCDLDEGLDMLRDLIGRPAPSLEALCDTVLGSLLPERPEDDIALLIARTRALGTDQVATWDLPSDPAVVAQARTSASAQLTAWGLDDLVFTTELVVSELVTNAIRYGQPPIRLRLIYDGTVICEVSDASSTAPHLRRARVFDEGGRGLLLVAQLTQRWGTRHMRTGKTIWAEQSIAS
ncbi:SpoIIE family protein phosphatase [Streptomyces sp. NPDC059455]|uniref:SpoIIE family protein phosphatase n=1 Tax=Streptomyces sp. NPDC059455 TaxID=3346837 RepID=UPI0036C655FB